MDEGAPHLSADAFSEALLRDSPILTWRFRSNEAIRTWQRTRYILTPNLFGPGIQLTHLRRAHLQRRRISPTLFISVSLSLSLGFSAVTLGGISSQRGAK